MKVGDLVTVRPAREGLYIIIGERQIPSDGKDSGYQDCWVLFSSDGLKLPMGKAWVVPSG
jgi:hypothetical protein